MNEHVVAAAAAEIEQMFGGKRRGRPGLVVIELAPADSNADGVLFVRSALADPIALETQLRRLTEFCVKHGLAPRLAVVAGRVKLGTALNERPDIAAVMEAAGEGCTWLGVGSLDRIARGANQFVEALELLMRSGLELVVADQGPRQVNLARVVEASAELLAAMRSPAFAERDRERMVGPMRAPGVARARRHDSA
jgi:DNA invertase Pin-like site-specific DNA recombinase